VISPGSYIVDASVAFKWYLVEEDNEIAGRILLAAQRKEVSLFAPDLLAIEVANIAWKRYRRDELSAEEACGVADDILGAPIAYIGSETLLHHATDLATRFGCTVYDSLYLALAEAYDAVLVTADRRLCEKVPAERRAGRVRLLEEIGE
jgi:predicted nucleic acid-binding protein